MNDLLKPFSYDPIKCELSKISFDIFSRLHPEKESSLTVIDFFKTFELPKDKSMGDFALPTFKFAKEKGLSPQELALKLKEGLLESHHFAIEKIDLKGPFLNIFISKKELAQTLIPKVLTGEWFQIIAKTAQYNRTKVMIEFSQPNTHKEFHVGHGRNVCIGDALCRLYRQVGYNVIAANYIGDEGTHIAKCLWGMKDYASSTPLTDLTTNKAEWLGKCYVHANNKLKSAESDSELTKQYQKEISKIHHDIESKSGDIYQTWKTTRQYCLDDFNQLYEWFGVSFDHFFYESEVSESSQAIVDEFIQKGLFHEDQGAIGLDMSDQKLGFFIARKSDGTTLYATKDLALAKVKFEQFNIDKSIYITAQEQVFHFKQVFHALSRMGFEQAKKCYHLAYGLVVRPDGKMSSRAGNSITFMELIRIVSDEMKIHLEKHQNEWTEKQMSDTLKKLTIGAIRYGMIEADPNKEIVFDPKEWVSFEGNSGPYLMYSYARTQSILSRAEEQNISITNEYIDLLLHDSEKDLMRSIYDFNATVLFAAENYRPSTLATHLYFMCKSYNRFYVEVSVFKAETPELMKARLALLSAFALTLKEGLRLLGIIPPDRM